MSECAAGRGAGRPDPSQRGFLEMGDGDWRGIWGVRGEWGRELGSQGGLGEGNFVGVFLGGFGEIAGGAGQAVPGPQAPSQVPRPQAPSSPMPPCF